MAFSSSCFFSFIIIVRVFTISPIVIMQFLGDLRMYVFWTIQQLSFGRLPKSPMETSLVMKLGLAPHLGRQ